MKTLYTITLLLLCSIGVSAQKVTVSQSEQKVNKIMRTGAAVYLELDEKSVKSAWKKQFKEFGKVSSSSGDLYIETASIPGINKVVRTISKVEKSGKGTMVWLAIDMGDEWAKNGGSGWGAMEKLLRDFGTRAYKDGIMEEIADAEKALAKTVKEQEKTMKQGENLKSDLEDNAEEKVRLENSLKDNASQKVQLEQDIQNNAKDQERMSGEVEKMKKAVDVVKDKLNHVE